MQVGVPSGKNTARFRGDEGESIVNTKILLHGTIWMGLEAFKTESTVEGIETSYKIDPALHRIYKPYRLGTQNFSTNSGCFYRICVLNTNVNSIRYTCYRT